MIRFTSLCALFLLACGTTPGAGDDTSSDDTSSDDTGPADASHATDAVPVDLEPADCDAFAANAVAAQEACGGPLPANAQATLAATCKRGLAKADLCGGDPVRGMACFHDPDPSDWVCQLGVVLPSCDGDLEAGLGAYCLVKLGDPACASIACETTLDCPSGASCNGATGQCFSLQANCVGLPCETSLDCPHGELCNGAEHACVMN